MIQRLLELSNPEIVYRGFLAVVCAPAPVMLYVLARRYTTMWVSILGAFILITSEYYSGYAMYARIHIALFWWLALLYCINKKGNYRYWFVSISTFGLLISHYSSSCIYLVIICFGLLVAFMVYKYRHESLSLLKPVVIGCMTMITGIIIYYGIISRYTRALHYPYITIRNIADNFNVKLPFWEATLPPPHQIKYYTPDINLSPSAIKPPIPPSRMGENITQNKNTGDYINKVFRLNPLAGERLDFMIAETLVLVRSGLALLIVPLLARSGKWRDPMLYFYIFGIILSLAGIWLPDIANDLGSLRLSFLSLPVEILAITLWHDGEKKRNWIIILLVGVLLIYH